MDRLATVHRRHAARPRAPSPGADGRGYSPVRPLHEDPEALDRSRVRTLRIPARPTGAMTGAPHVLASGPVPSSGPADPIPA